MYAPNVLGLWLGSEIKMAYYIKNHMLKDKIYYFPEWIIIGLVCTRDEYAQKAEIKVCKDPDVPLCAPTEKFYVKLVEVITKIPTAPKIESRIFTHTDYIVVGDPISFQWQILADKGKTYEFDARLVGWVLYRLRGEKLKWHLIPRVNGAGILVFTKAADIDYIYAMVACSYSSEYEKSVYAVGR